MYNLADSCTLYLPTLRENIISGQVLYVSILLLSKGWCTDGYRDKCHCLKCNEQQHFQQSYPCNNTKLLKRFGGSRKNKLLPKVKQLPGGKSHWDGQRAAEAQANWAWRCMCGYCITVPTKIVSIFCNKWGRHSFARIHG